MDYKLKQKGKTFYLIPLDQQLKKRTFIDDDVNVLFNFRIIKQFLDEK